MEVKVALVNQVLLVLQVYQDQEDNQVHKATWDHQVLKVAKDSKVFLGIPTKE